jgi:hypothetical protein
MEKELDEIDNVMKEVGSMGKMFKSDLTKLER